VNNRCRVGRVVADVLGVGCLVNVSGECTMRKFFASFLAVLGLLIGSAQAAIDSTALVAMGADIETLVGVVVTAVAGVLGALLALWGLKMGYRKLTGGK